MKQYAEFIQQHPRVFLLIFGILVVAAVYPALQIRTDFNLENFFPQNDPTIKEYQYLEREFGRDDNIIMVGFRSDSLLSPAVLMDLKSMVDSAAGIPDVTEVRSLWSAENIRSEGSRLEFDPYLELGDLERLDRDRLKKELLEDRFTEGFFINRDANVTAFYLEIDEQKNSFEIREQVIDRLNRILDSYDSKYDFRISGIPHYRNQYVHYLNDEIVFYITLSSLMIVILLGILYRSVLGVLFPMLIVWLTILFTLAIMQLTGGYFEVMSSTIAPILLCVGVADSIHMISKYDDARKSGMQRGPAITEMLMTLGTATFLTSITTAIGFGTLMTSSIIPMMRFGIYTAVGVMVAFAITVTLLPSVLSFTAADRIFHDKKGSISDFLNSVLTKICRLNRSHYRSIIALFFLVTLAAGSGIWFLKVNGKVFDELGRETKPIRDAEFFSRNLTPPYPMEFIIDTGSENGIADPVFLTKVETFIEYLNSLPEVQRVVSINSLLKEVHRAMAPERYRDNELPDAEDLISQYLLLLEFSESGLLERVSDFSYQRVRIAANINDVGSYRVNRIQSSLEEYLGQLFPEQEIVITGTTILSADLNGKIVSSLFKSILLAFALISIIMAVLFKNIRMVLISLVPNLLPLICVAGLMGYTGIDIKASTAVIFTIAFGIAVDDSIHFLARVRVEMSRGRSLSEALPYTTLNTGKAIVVTSLILLAGFGSLLTSVFQSTVYMGLLVGLTIGFALLADILLLPALFYWLRPDLKFSQDEKIPASRSPDESVRGDVLHPPQ